MRENNLKYKLTAILSLCVVLLLSACGGGGGGGDGDGEAKVICGDGEINGDEQCDGGDWGEIEQCSDVGEYKTKQEAKLTVEHIVAHGFWGKAGATPFSLSHMIQYRFYQ